MNNDELPLPQDPSEIPRGKIRACVLIPPLLFLVFAIVVGMGALPLALVAIIICGGRFMECLSVRYRGRSLALLGGAYVIGEIVACAAILVPFAYAEGLI